jgi:hypothetical protein
MMLGDSLDNSRVETFGHLLVQLDPWQVDYESELPLDETEELARDETAVLDGKIAPDRWQHIRPGHESRRAALGRAYAESIE